MLVEIDFLFPPEQKKGSTTRTDDKPLNSFTDFIPHKRSEVLGIERLGARQNLKRTNPPPRESEAYHMILKNYFL